MKPAERLPVFVTVFAVVCSVVYILAVYKNYALFTYHPATGQFGAGVEKAGPDGPAMYWYGWIATSSIAGAIAGLIACALPRSLARRVWPGFSWAIPLAGIAVLLYILRNYFLH